MFMILKKMCIRDRTKNVVTENNTAKTTIDSKTSTTNQVTTTVEGPKKTVSDADETNVTNNTVRSLADDWTYLITQKIAKNANEKYTSFAFKDSIEQCMKINSVKVKADNGKDVTSWFDVSTVGNEVKATLDVYKRQVENKVTISKKHKKDKT